MNNSIAMQGSIHIKPRQRRLKHKDHDFKGQAAFHSEPVSKKCNDLFRTILSSVR